MPYNSGVYTLPSNSFANPVTGAVISSSGAISTFADFALAFSTAVLKDGTSTLTASIPFGGFKATGLGAGTAAGHSLRYEQLFSTSPVQLLGALDQFKGADIASATTLNLTAATGNAVHVTGTTTITGVTLGSGLWRLVIFDGALTLTNHTTNNRLPGLANITTAANDRALYWSDGTTVYCVVYIRDATGASPTKKPTQQLFVTGSGTYTTPSGCTRIHVRAVGGGGGGGGGGTAPTSVGSDGGDTTFGSLTAGKGLGAAASGAPSNGGVGSGADINLLGGGSAPGGTTANVNNLGGSGGASVFGGGGSGATTSAGGSVGQAYGSGGGGGSITATGATNYGGAGGSAGGAVESVITSPAASYSYAVGAAGAAGGAGTQGTAGGAGKIGAIFVFEYYD